MHNTFPEDTISLNTICKTFNQLYIEEEHKLAEHFYQNACTSSVKLLEIDQKNFVALLTKAILFEKDKILEAREILINGDFFLKLLENVNFNVFVFQ